MYVKVSLKDLLRASWSQANLKFRPPNRLITGSATSPSRSYSYHPSIKHCEISSTLTSNQTFRLHEYVQIFFLQSRNSNPLAHKLLSRDVKAKGFLSFANNRFFTGGSQTIILLPGNACKSLQIWKSRAKPQTQLWKKRLLLNLSVAVSCCKSGNYCMYVVASRKLGKYYQLFSQRRDICLVSSWHYKCAHV